MTELHADHPVSGWYRYRPHKDARWQPCVIWRKDGELVCLLGYAKTPTDPHKIWTWVADKKVNKEDAKFAFDNGHWPDEPPPTPERPNMPTDPYEALRAEIADKQEQAEKWLASRPTITTQLDADYARNQQAELLALNKRADAMFGVEKAPLIEASRACDAKWSFRKSVADVAERLRKVYGRFLAAEEARLKAEAAAKLKAERERIEAERKAKLADDPVAALTEPEPQLPLLPEPVKVQAGGGVGRRAGLKTVWVPTVTDYGAAAMFFINHPDLKAEVDRLVKHAVKDAKGSIVIPGVTINEDREAA